VKHKMSYCNTVRLATKGYSFKASAKYVQQNVTYVDHENFEVKVKLGTSYYED